MEGFPLFVGGGARAEGERRPLAEDLGDVLAFLHVVLELREV